MIPVLRPWLWTKTKITETTNHHKKCYCFEFKRTNDSSSSSHFQPIFYYFWWKLVKYPDSFIICHLPASIRKAKYYTIYTIHNYTTCGYRCGSYGYFLFLSFCGCAISLGSTEIYEAPKRKCSLFVIHFYKGHEFRRGSVKNSLQVFLARIFSTLMIKP